MIFLFSAIKVTLHWIFPKVFSSLLKLLNLFFTCLMI